MATKRKTTSPCQWGGRRSTQRPLRDQLLHMAKCAKFERGIAYTRLAEAAGVDTKTLHRTLIGGEYKMAEDSLIRVLYVLGYECVLTIRERELTQDERQYFTDTRAPIPANIQATIARGENPAISVRVLD